MEQSLVLIKPDAVERNIIGEIIHQYERNGLKISRMQLMNATEKIARKHYEELEDKPFFEDLITYITRGPLVALVIEGENAIEAIRAINGVTNPEEAAPNTIRALYGNDVTENSVHASDSPESAEREIAIWF